MIFGIRPSQRSIIRWIAVIFAVWSAQFAYAENQCGINNVVAHYHMPFSAFGDDYSKIREEIRVAKRLNIEGFVVNVGGQVAAGRTAVQLARLFDAAEEEGLFKIIISIDVSTDAPGVDESINLLNSYFGRRAYWKCEGRPVFFSWNASRGYDSRPEFWTRVIGKLKDSGWDPIHLATVFLKDGNSLVEHPNLQQLLSLTRAWIGTPAHGLSLILGPDNFSLKQRTETIQNYSHLIENGLPISIGVIPEYWGMTQKSSNRIFRDGGIPEFYDTLVFLKNEIKPSFIQIFTWNDFTEASYIAPVSSQSVVSNNRFLSRYGELFFKSHAGYAQAVREAFSKSSIGKNTTFLSQESPSGSEFCQKRECRRISIFSLDRKTDAVKLASPQGVVSLPLTRGLWSGYLEPGIYKIKISARLVFCYRVNAATADNLISETDYIDWASGSSSQNITTDQKCEKFQ